MKKTEIRSGKRIKVDRVGGVWVNHDDFTIVEIYVDVERNYYMDAYPDSPDISFIAQYFDSDADAVEYVERLFKEVNT